MEQVTSETSVTFPSPLLLPLPYRQYFACGKNPGNLLRLSTPESFQRQKRKTTRFWVASNWSRLRGSNSLPPPWQGGALPDELNLRCRQRCLLYRTAGRLSRNFFITAELFQQTPPRPERSFPSKAGNRTTAWSENRRNLPVQFPSKAKRSPGWMTAYSGTGYRRNVCDVSKSPLAALAV